MWIALYPRTATASNVLVPARHDDRDAAAHGLTHPHAGSDVDRRVTLHRITVAQSLRDLPHGMVVRGGDVLDSEDLGDLGTTVSDAEVVDADHDQAALDMVRRLAVSAVPFELHVEVAPRVTSAGHGEHHHLPIIQPLRRREVRRRNDRQRTIECARLGDIDG